MNNNHAKIKREQLRLLYTQMPTALFATLLIAALSVQILYDCTAHAQLIPWFLAIVVVSLSRFLVYLKYQGCKATDVNTRLYERLFLLGVIAAGCLWGYLGLFLFPSSEAHTHQIAVIIIILGMAAGSTATLGPNWIYSLTFNVIVIVPMLIRLQQTEYDITHHLLTLGLMFIILMGISARRTDQAYRTALGMRFAKEEAEVALRESAENNRLLLESAGEGIYGLDMHGNATFVNPAAERMLGYATGEMIGQPNHALIHHTRIDGSPYPHEQCRMMEPTKTGQAARVDDEILWRKDGSSFPVEYTSTPIIQNGTCQGIVVNFRDISERQRIEQALLEERSLFIAGPIVAFKWLNAPGWPVASVSPNIRGQFGYDPDNLLNTHQCFADLLHPADRERVGQEVEAYTGGGLQHFEQEYRILDAFGHYRWVYDFTVAVRDPENHIQHFHGYIFDITERKRAEEALRLAATTFEAHEAIAITDDRGKFLRVNHAFTRITGYTSEEAIGKSPQLLKSGRHDDAFYTAMWKELSHIGHWEGEIWNQRKNGEIYPEWLSITAVRDELGETSHYLAHFQDISERKQAQAYIEYQAFYDPLTELPNRRLLLKRLTEELARCRRHAHIGALLFLDLDRFKTINDSLGHAVGDQLLRQVAERLVDNIRTEDAAARLGGDEFVVLLNELSGEPEAATRIALERAESVRIALSRPYTIEGRTLNTSPSIGIALFPLDGEGASDVLKHADIAMYSAKVGGRNRIQFYLPSMQLAAKEKLRIEEELRLALKEERLLLHYQPQVDINGDLIGCEALLRWQHPEQGLLSPDIFLHIAEESGLIIPIGEQVLEQACAQLAVLEEAGLPAQFTRLAVNISPSQFEDPAFIDSVCGIINRHGIDPHHLELELTEQLLLKDFQRTLDIIEILQAEGIQFAIDDFGTGYSSLAYLKKLPVDRLKIDGTFVRDVVEDADDAAIVDTIIAMAHTMKMHVVAEGVQTYEQWDYLRHKGCHYYQGYYFHRPMPGEDFTQLIKATAP